LTRKAQVHVGIAKGKAKVLIRADGTMTFDEVAVRTFRLRGVESMMVFFSMPEAMFVLRLLPKGSGWGVPLIEVENGVIAEQAADFLEGTRFLPAKDKKYEGHFFEEANAIVIWDVGVCRRRVQ
jgi:hypothetical protein